MDSIILCGGRGSRMKSDIPKQLLQIDGKSILQMLIASLLQVQKIKSINIVVSPSNQKLILKHINQVFPTVQFRCIIQENPLGTGDAVLSCVDILQSNLPCLILNGDTPLITSELLNNFIDNYNGKDQLAVMNLENPFGYGRIIKNKGIVEEKDCDGDQKKVTLVNGGIYIITNLSNLLELKDTMYSDITKEYYLTKIFSDFNTFEITNPSLLLNVNTPEDLAKARKLSPK